MTKREGKSALERAHEQVRVTVLLMSAIDRHLFLTFESVNWYTPEAMKLYVEMRLLADEQKVRREVSSHER